MSEAEAENSVNLVTAGFAGRCPSCGEGPLFSSFLGLADGCEECGLDYSFADTGDGPAVFGILIIGFIIVGLALWMELAIGAPLWLHILLWVPLALVLTIGFLRFVKGLLIAVQYRNKAAEGRLDRPL